MAASTNTNVILEHLEEGKVYDLEFGDTWNATNDGHPSKYAYHTVKYDFKPASVVKSEQAELTVGSTDDVSITLPNVEGSLTQSTKFSGSTKSYTPKECVMIIDPHTGKIVLERLSANVRVKNVRMENRPANPVIKATIPRSSQPDSQGEKKTAKPATAAAKVTTQKVNTSSKPTVNAPVKPMPSKVPLSPMDDRLSDEELSPDQSTNTATLSSNSAPVQTHALQRRASHATLEQDLQLSDTTDDEA
ncbi:unnamed protein product [Adineta ricciae]|uniref:Transcription elongation factor Eaf N-terminal domain-containing protein n=1 Tax=Adineta ricciae TaxID=249248 RepID=A0A814FSN8_ADIRI|nr:unnamed protein product [Adineta ricciae]CAF0986996.1 unnamed protein product [Adineta ricciae]